MAGCGGQHFYFCGSKASFEAESQSLMSLFSVSMQDALVSYYMAALESAKSFSADIGNEKTSSAEHWRESQRISEGLSEKFRNVSEVAARIGDFLNGRMRDEFLDVSKSINLSQLLDERKSAGAYPLQAESSYGILNPLSNGEGGYVEMFDNFRQRADELSALSHKQVEALHEYSALTEMGGLYDTVYSKSLLDEKVRHSLMDLEESFHARVIDLQVQYETILQFTRAVALKSSIPYQECKRK